MNHEAAQRATQCSNLRDQARDLTDKSNIITTRIRDVLRACIQVSDDMKAEHWDSVRITALVALKGM